MQMQDAVNDRDWKGIKKWCARIDGIDAGSKYENNVAFVELTLDVALKRETWMTRVLDCGFFELSERPSANNQGGGIDFIGTAITKREWTRIRDPYSHEAVEPQPLDGKGRKLRPDADPVFLSGLPDNYHLENFAKLILL